MAFTNDFHNSKAVSSLYPKGINGWPYLVQPCWLERTIMLELVRHNEPVDLMYLFQSLRYMENFIFGGKRRLRYQLYACGEIFHMPRYQTKMLLNQLTQRCTKQTENEEQKQKILAVLVEEEGKVLSEISSELREHDRRLVRLETLVEVAKAQKLKSVLCRTV